MKRTRLLSAQKGLKRLAGMSTAFLLLMSSVGGAQARILFQDDVFHDIVSEGLIINSDETGDEDATLQLGNDGTDATILFDDGTGDLSITTTGGDISFGDENLTTTGGLDVDGNVNFSNASEVHIRENADPATNSACTTLGELILDTTDSEIQVCTTVGVAGAAVWTNVASGSTQDFESVYSADGDNTLTASSTFDIDATGAVGIDSDAASAAALRLNASNAAGGIDADAGTGGIAFDTTGSFSIQGANPSDLTVASDGAADDLTIAVTGATDSSVVVNSSGTGTDAVDINATAGGITVDSAAGVSIDAAGASNLTTTSGDLTLSSTTGSSVVTGGEAVADAVQITASNAAGGVDVNAGTGGVAIDSTGAVSVDAVGASNLTTDSGALTIETTTSGDLNLTGAGNIVFDDGTITGTIQLSNSDTDWAATFADDGIVDVINSFTSTATGEGASNIGIEDAGTFFTGTDVEAALQELGADAANNNDVLTFNAEYPDTVVHQDGTANKGKLVSEYDSTGDRNYYEWTSKTGSLQDIDLRFRFELPTDWTDPNDLTIDFQTGTAVVGQNRFDVSLVNITNASTTCASSTGNVNVAWTTVTLAEATIETGCTGGTVLDAGDIVEVQIKLYSDNTSGAFARSGPITWDYDN